MSGPQRQALQMMANGNHGAILIGKLKHINGGWIFPEHIRRDDTDTVAYAVIERISK